MFTINEIYIFIRFLNDYKLEFAINEETNEVEFFDENRTMQISLETFDNRPMWKNIERIRIWIDKEAQPWNIKEMTTINILEENETFLGTDAKLYFTIQH